MNNYNQKYNQSYSEQRHRTKPSYERNLSETVKFEDNLGLFGQWWHKCRQIFMKASLVHLKAPSKTTRCKLKQLHGVYYSKRYIVRILINTLKQDIFYVLMLSLCGWKKKKIWFPIQKSQQSEILSQAEFWWWCLSVSKDDGSKFISLF